MVIRDPRAAITRHFDIASLVTLSDFGGKDEQKAINTGLVAARPGADTEALFEEWMKLEVRAWQMLPATYAAHGPAA